jgi:hypothetical protein
MKKTNQPKETIKNMENLYYIKGMYLHSEHGYLATRRKTEVKAFNKKDAISKARKILTTCNDFEVIKVEDFNGVEVK